MTTARIATIGASVAVALSLPFYGYTWNLFMHIFGAILFMGNIMASAVWMSLARRARSTEALRLGARGVVLTDALFTLPASVLLLLNGGILGTPFFRAGATWLFVAIGLFVASAVLWMGVLIPAQRRLNALMTATPATAAIPEEAEALLATWFRWGGLATLLPLVSLVLMVTKPAF